jgi:riboflavin biosynthesis pyrimidine reductase
VDVRVLIDEAGDRAGRSDLSDDDLVGLYRPARTSWWRINMVSTVDGSATGESGRSGSINNGADKRVFDTLRGLADAIVVGAGTARDEGYGPADVPVVLVSRRGHVPEKLRDAPRGSVLLATTSDAEGLAASRKALGEEHVIVTGDEVDLTELRRELAGRGLTSVLSEGGPSLFADLAAAGVLDEVCLTVVPRLLGGDHPRIATGADAATELCLTTLLEHDGTLLGRWQVGTSADG